MLSTQHVGCFSTEVKHPSNIDIAHFWGYVFVVVLRRRQVSWTDEEEEFYRFHEESFYAERHVRDLSGLSDNALFRQKGNGKVLPGSSREWWGMGYGLIWIVHPF